MKIFIIIISIIILFLIILWIYGFNKANDLKVPNKDINDFKNIKKVLIIFPHADDEANSLSGTITKFTKNNIQVDWLLLTKGEKGNEDAHYDDNLKVTRLNEAKNVSKILGINNFITRDYPDNGVSEFADKLKDDIKNVIVEENPDLIITYDESGYYGHPDHIVVSKVVTGLIESDFKNIALWYITRPEKLIEELNLPEQMAKDKKFKSDRKFPNFKVFTGVDGLINKEKVIYTYQSQFNSFVKSMPIKQIPMWFYISLTPYEYFYEVKPL